MKTINIFLIGTGLIGSTLLEQIKAIKNKSQKENLKIQISGLANQKNMLIDEKGIDISKWEELLEKNAIENNVRIFISKVKNSTLANKIFVDCTASDEIIKFYDQILKSKISIVTPNKKANAGDIKSYKKIHDAKNTKALFLYETNVGAGLPIIQTINDLIATGDEIIKIEGILSGTLSYIFNNFKAERKFSEIVKKAKENGYTEPDPRDDLNGLDFGRKLLIIAREIGLTLNINDIQIENLIPKKCRNAKSVDDFFAKLTSYDLYFEKLKSNAKSKQKELRYIGCIDIKNRKFSCSIKMINATHPFYSLSESDNIISITTKRYNKTPLVIKGPGAGAQVTASGVLADILKVSRSYTYDPPSLKLRKDHASEV